MTTDYIVFDIETTGLNWTNSIITCICAKNSEQDYFIDYGLSEISIISHFFEWLNKHEDIKLISANGKDFDIPFIFGRALLNDINITPLSFTNHIDIINDFTDKKISLNNICKLLNLSSKNGNGENAIKLFESGRFHDLGEYCMNDVEITEKAYLKLMELRK